MSAEGAKDGRAQGRDPNLTSAPPLGSSVAATASIAICVARSPSVI